MWKHGIACIKARKMDMSLSCTAVEINLIYFQRYHLQKKFSNAKQSISSAENI